jgi:hypothetical protein
MSGRRPLIKGFFRRCTDRGCGHVFGLGARTGSKAPRLRLETRIFNALAWMQARGEQRTTREANEKPPRSFVKFSEGCMISDQWYQWSSVRILVPEGDLERYAAADKSAFSKRYSWMRSAEKQIASTGSNSGGLLHFYWSRSGRTLFDGVEASSPCKTCKTARQISSLGEGQFGNTRRTDLARFGGLRLGAD